MKRISKIIIETFFGTVSSKKIAILGFSFKSNTNDIRYSPAINIASDLLDNGANLYIHDPQVSEDAIASKLGKKNKNTVDGSWRFTRNLNIAFDNADAIIITTEWEDYLNIDWIQLSSLMRKPSWLFDTRGIIEESRIEKLNMNFWKIGKGFIKQD